MPPSRLDPNQREVLGYTKALFQYHMIQTTGQVCDRVLVQVAVLKPRSRSSSTAGNTSELLMLRRRAHEDGEPNEGSAGPTPPSPGGVFELPGGNVEETDRSIQEALVRRVREATGLSVRQIFMRLTEMTFPSERTVRQDGTIGPAERITARISYVVEVESAPPDAELEINQDAYSEAAWVTQRTLETYPMEDETHSLMWEALQRLDSQA